MFKKITFLHIAASFLVRASRSSCSAPDEISPKELESLLGLGKGMAQPAVFPLYSSKTFEAHQ